MFQNRNGLVADGIIGAKTLLKMMGVFNISSESKLAHFAAQVSHETANFKYNKENLNYSADGLRKTFGKYFKNYLEMLEYAHNPEKIANRVYANRNGNGNEESGDGWKFRGRGSLQLTGRDNYEIFANKVRDLRIMDNPELVSAKYFWESALFYFDNNRVWSLAEDISNESIVKVTKKINGGVNGLQDRINLTQKFYKMLCN